MNSPRIPLIPSRAPTVRAASPWLAFIACALAWLAASSASPGVGAWSPLTNRPSGNVGLMVLLSDGTVIAFNSATSNAIYRLTPDAQGHYLNGTWTTLASMHDTRLYFATQVLKDGRVFVAGGEYGTGRKTGETYDPLTNKWKMAPPSGHTFSDSNSEILANGRVLTALVEGSLRGTLIFDPVANTWTNGPTAIGIHNESAWVKLPDDSILFVDRLTTNSERYIPSQNQWIVDATVPVALYDPYGDEKGADLLMPNGKAFFLGSTGHTAIYTPSGSTAAGTWVAGPDIPNASGTPDAPAAMLPNGKILCAVSPIPTSTNHFPSPTTFYEYDYLTNAFTTVPTPTGATLNHSSYYGTMLVLPDGTVLYSDFNSQIYSYQPDSVPVASGKPVISSVTQNADGSFHLIGTQLNGISEGSCYGDDNQNATNYPIVRLTSGATVYRVRTFNWSSTGVMTGAAPVSTEFAIPASVPAGTYSLTVTANGISSDPVSFTNTPIIVTVPASATEGSAPSNATLTLPSAPASDLTVDLASGNTARATVPASVTVLAGQTTASFQVTIIDDNILTGAQAVAISAASAGYQTGLSYLNVLENDSAVLSITPSGTIAWSGLYGGPFTASPTSYTLTNTGNQPLTWAAVKTATWLSLSTSSGTLAGGASVTLTTSIINAGTLAVGSYTDTITFNNNTTGDGNTTRTVSLNITGAPSMSVTSGSYTASGLVGGPFTPSSAAYIVANNGTAPMTWTVSKTAAWNSLSTSGGTIQPGATGTVTVSIVTASANALAAGTYSDTITLTNTNNGAGNTTRPVALTVSLPAPVVQAEPPITGGASNAISWTAVTGADHYEAQSSTSASFAAPVSSGFITGTSFTFTNLTDGLTYYRVRARRTSALVTDSAWSNPVSSTQDNTPPALTVSGVTSTMVSSVTLQGTASDLAGVQSLTVGGSVAQTNDGFAHWNATVTLAVGVNNVAVVAGDGASPANVRTTTYPVTRLADADQDGLPDTWEDAHSLAGASRSPTADPDFDGLNNLLEYAFNLDPNAPDTTGLPVGTVVVNPADGRPHLHFSYRRWIGGGGVQYVVETSPDFNTWSASGADLSADGDPVPNGDGVTETVNLWINPAADLVPMKVVRVRVSGL